MPPPEGFTALFNGKDLNGWWGLTTENPAKWMALSPEKLAEKKKKSSEDIKKHWSIEGTEFVSSTTLMADVKAISLIFPKIWK